SWPLRMTSSTSGGRRKPKRSRRRPPLPPPAHGPPPSSLLAIVPVQKGSSLTSPPQNPFPTVLHSLRVLRRNVPSDVGPLRWSWCRPGGGLAARDHAGRQPASKCFPCWVAETRVPTGFSQTCALLWPVSACATTRTRRSIFMCGSGELPHKRGFRSDETQ